MGNINIHNYESFLIDFIEDQLKEELRAELLEFLDNHPDLKAELDSFEMINVPVDQNIIFKPKQELKQKNLALDYHDELLIGYVEETLTSKETQEVEELIANDITIAQNLKLYQLSKCKADPKILFQSKNQIKKYPFYLQTKFYYSVAVAATIALLIGIGSSLLNRDEIIPNEMPYANIIKPSMIKGTHSFITLNMSISELKINRIETTYIEINLNEIDRFIPDPLITLRSNIKQLQQFAFNYKVSIDQVYLLEKSEYYNPEYYEMIAQVQMNSNRVKLGQAIWKGLFGKLAFKKISNKTEQDKSSDGVMFWAITSIGVDHINTLTGSDLKLHRKVNDDGEFSGYSISNKEFESANVLENSPN